MLLRKREQRNTRNIKTCTNLAIMTRKNTSASNGSRSHLTFPLAVHITTALKKLRWLKYILRNHCNKQKNKQKNKQRNLGVCTSVLLLAPSSSISFSRCTLRSCSSCTFWDFNFALFLVSFSSCSFTLPSNVLLASFSLFLTRFESSRSFFTWKNEMKSG